MTLFYRPNRKCWYGNHTVDGKRYKRKLCATKGESKRLHAQWVTELEARHGRRTCDPELRLQRFVDDEYMPWARGAKSVAMITREDLVIRTWVEVIGDTPLVRIGEWSAARYQTVRRKTCTARTVNHDVGVISQILNCAVRWGRLDRNRLAGFKKLREIDREPRWLNAEEVDALVAVVPPRLLPVVIVFLNCGLRRSELVRLEWSDVDLTARTLAVRHKGEVTTKSKRERIVDLNDLVVQTLRDHRRQLRTRFRKLPSTVFVTGRGTPLRNNLLRDLKAAYREAGIGDANIHTLRHTFGAQAVMAGIDLPTLQLLMGHADIKTTMIYAHVDRRHQAAAINRLALGAPRPEADVTSLADERARRARESG